MFVESIKSFQRNYRIKDVYNQSEKDPMNKMEWWMSSHSPSVSNRRIFSESGTQGRNLFCTSFKIHDTATLPHLVVVILECINRIQGQNLEKKEAKKKDYIQDNLTHFFIEYIKSIQIQDIE